jgi:cytochrome P450
MTLQPIRNDRMDTEVMAEQVPGPPGSPLLGMTRTLQRDQLGTYESVTAEYGDVVRMVLGPPGLRRVIYLVTHPDGVEQVLAGNGYTKDTPYYREIAAYLGDGLLTSEGQQRRQQRRTVAPLFTHRRIAGYVDVMAEEAARLAGRWHEPARRGTPVDVSAEMVDFTLRAIGRILFGASVDDVVPVVQETFPILNQHVRRRGLTPLRLPRGFPTPAQRQAARAQQRLYEVVDAIIERRRRTAGGVDLIARLVGARDPETGAALSPQEVRDQVLIFLLAGHETTSTALTFACHLLGRHPAVQRRVHEELDGVLAGQAPTADGVGKLSYTTMVVKEAMRLYPSAYAFGRLCATGDRIAGGHRIPPNSIVVLSPWATHRRADLWPDPGRFDPDRFEPAAEAARPRYAYLPFAGGLRGCIGSHFAMTEAVTAVATLLSTFVLESESDSVPLSTGITLRPAGPVRCRVSPRPA